jgi:hypothetical protein
MDAIQARINSPYYTNALAFQEDFIQMFKNAMIYNDENSEVYFDAVEMQNMCVNSLKQQLVNGQISVTDQDRLAAATEMAANPVAVAPKKKRMSGPVKKRKVLSDYESDPEESEEEEQQGEEGLFPRGRYDGELPDIGY